jgi:hypothetical protein
MHTHTHTHTHLSTQENMGGNDASFDCMPMNMDVMDPACASTEMQGGSFSSSFVSSFNSRRTSDCKKWTPDMPEILGLYHAYVRGFNKDTRYHETVRWRSRRNPRAKTEIWC